MVLLPPRDAGGSAPLEGGCARPPLDLFNGDMRAVRLRRPLCTFGDRHAYEDNGPTCKIREKPALPTPPLLVLSPSMGAIDRPS